MRWKPLELVVIVAAIGAYAWWRIAPAAAPIGPPQMLRVTLADPVVMACRSPVPLREPLHALDGATLRDATRLFGDLIRAHDCRFFHRAESFIELTRDGDLRRVRVSKTGEEVWLSRTAVEPAAAPPS